MHSAVIAHKRHSSCSAESLFSGATEGLMNPDTEKKISRRAPAARLLLRDHLQSSRISPMVGIYNLSHHNMF